MQAVGGGYSGHDMKVWLGKVFSSGHRQMMCCALVSTSEGKRCEEEST